MVLIARPDCDLTLMQGRIIKGKVKVYTEVLMMMQPFYLHTM